VGRAFVHLVGDQVCCDNSPGSLTGRVEDGTLRLCWLASLIGQVEDEVWRLRSPACMIWLGIHPGVDTLAVGETAPSDCYVFQRPNHHNRLLLAGHHSNPQVVHKDRRSQLRSGNVNGRSSRP
jgi:hypothetical protein